MSIRMSGSTNWEISEGKFNSLENIRLILWNYKDDYALVDQGYPTSLNQRLLCDK